MQDAAPKLHPGEVVEIESEEELDTLLREDSESLTVLLASLTWCRPCKTLAKPLQVRQGQGSEIYLYRVREGMAFRETNGMSLSYSQGLATAHYNL